MQDTQADRLGHASVPRRIRASLLARNPHWLRQWAAKVPLSHLTYDVAEDVVTVRCHNPIELVRDEVASCAGCDRWFWRLPRAPMVEGIRVARWEPCEIVDRWAGDGWTPVDEVVASMVAS
jgi:hypothetical protein